ncbi:MAG: prephenate dehydratase, partial [Actinomycetales bacterium]|nr:prephenate dehydratase [Actinomycetales bacterium]
MRYGFLGPETTFTHQALLQALAETPEEHAAGDPVLVPFASVATATTDLLAGDIDALMAPIENSVEGGVSGTLDVLAATDAITIVAEQTVQITFVLAAREATPLDELTTVSSHPHAQAQVQGWLRRSVSEANIAAASSTAAAARDLA